MKPTFYRRSDFPVAALDQLQDFPGKPELLVHFERLALFPVLVRNVRHERQSLSAQLPNRLCLVERHGLPPVTSPCFLAAAIRSVPEKHWYKK